jgi:SNF2 family DNA or RNA helicase
MLLDALLKLRQVCCDPQLVKIEVAKKVEESAKLQLFLDLLEELLSENRKILVFSQFTSMLSILQNELEKKDISYTKLTGATKKREEVIEKFTSGQADVFLISLKAGGVGLNLTEADTVIHYDPWWNPAVENQATDRAHRIGQTKAVFVYKLIIENSIEEKILELQQKKLQLQQGIYKGGKTEKISGKELLKLLK